MSLVVHTGAASVDRHVLDTLPVPKAMGPRHFIQPFNETVEMVVDNFTKVGLRLKDESYAVLFDRITNNPQRFFGLIEVELEGHMDPTYALQIGVRGSYDQSISSGLAVGSRVFVCDNLAFHGEATFMTKQTLNISKRLPMLIGGVVDKIPALAGIQSSYFDRLKNTTLTPKEGDAMLIECVRRGVLNSTQLPAAIREWDEPTYMEHTDLGFSAWRLHNAVTMAMKELKGGNPLGQTWDRTMKIADVIDVDEFAVAA
jgi:hypothetical protein